MKSFKNKARSAVVWSALDIVIRSSGGFVVTIFLARLLTPNDFGTVALLSIFLGISNVFMNVGLGQALIQRQDVSHIDESTVFWFNVIAAIVMMLILIGASPWIADFFELPVLAPIAMVLAANIVIGALGTVHATLMSKQLDFKAQTNIGIISTFASGVVAIYLATSGYGVWALIVHTVLFSLLGTVLLWIYSPWRPLLTFSSDSFKKLFGFGGWLFLSELLDNAYHRGYTLLIGKFYSAHELGIYDRADSTQKMPVSILSRILQRVTFPVLSVLNHDSEQVLKGVRLSIRSVTLITTPMMMGLIVISEPFINVVFGEQWGPAVPILQVLCLAGIFRPVHIVNLTALQALGYSKLFFRLEVIKKTIGVCLLIAGSFFGLMGIAWSRVIQSVIGLLINSYYTGRFIGYGFTWQLKDMLPAFLSSTFMAMMLSFILDWSQLSDLIALIVSVLVGAIIYLIVNVLIGGSAFSESVQLIRDGINKS